MTGCIADSPLSVLTILGIGLAFGYMIALYGVQDKITQLRNKIRTLKEKK